MDIAALINYLSQLTDLGEGFKQIVTAQAQQEIYRPKQILLAKGQTENRLWFVSKGMVRSYYFDNSGKEHTLFFYKEYDVVFSFDGFWKQPSACYLELLESSQLVSLSYQTIQTELLPYRETSQLTELFVRRQLQRERLHQQLLTMNAEERYHFVRRQQAWLFARVSVRLIASYLNMTRENLSRIMARDN